jgi:ankyrin repeat protein
MGSQETTEQLNKAAMSYLNVLLSSIEEKDWDLFGEVGIQNPKAFRALANILATSSEFHGMTFLHAAVRHNPPLNIVAGITTICPDAPSRRDCLNRTSLHVAAGVGANVDVIKYLAMAAPETCKVQDEDGRTPLHFACDVDCQLFEGEERRRDPPTYETVHALLCANFSSAAIEDADEMSPLEYAIFSHADIRVVKLLQKAAQKHMKEMSASRKENNQSISLSAAA